MENISTKDEFSDFEDEIQQKCVDNNQENKEAKETKETNSEDGSNECKNNEYFLKELHHNMINEINLVEGKIES